MCYPAQVSALRLRARAFRVCAHKLEYEAKPHFFRALSEANLIPSPLDTLNMKMSSLAVLSTSDQKPTYYDKDLAFRHLLASQKVRFRLAKRNCFISDCIAPGDTESRLKQCALFAAAGARAVRRPRVGFVVSCLCGFFRCVLNCFRLHLHGGTPLLHRCNLLYNS